MNRIFWFFDLYSQHRNTFEFAQGADDDKVSARREAAIYIACLAGIFAGPFAIEAAKGKYPNLLEMFGSWPHVLWSVLFSFILTAALFKVWLTPKSPIISQIGVAIAVGMSSGKLLPIALEALTKSLS